MNNRGQIQAIAFFIVILALLIFVAPFMLKVGVTMIDKTITSLAPQDTTNKSTELMSFTRNKLTQTTDWVVMFIVLLNILLLLITSFLIDVNPAFVALYIIAAFALVLTAPYTIVMAEKVFDMEAAGTLVPGSSENVISYLPMTEFMKDNFGLVIVGVLVLSGIIIYAKIKFFSQSGGRNVY